MNFKKLYDLNKYLYKQVTAQEKWTSAGGVVVNEKGEIALVKPSGGFGGYQWTYPKGGQESGETLEQTALREVKEESGLVGKIVAPLGKFEGTSSFTYYFLMKLEQETGHHDQETEEVKFVTPEKARGMLNPGRDQKVLDKVLQNWSRVFKQQTATASRKVIAINRRRFFVKKLLNFLSQDFTKGYTAAQIAQSLNADMEKVNHALTYLTESGKIKNREGLFGVGKQVASISNQRSTQIKAVTEPSKDVSRFNNWAELTPEQIKQEYEWEYISHIKDRWPFFENFNDFKQAVENAEVLTLTKERDAKVLNRSHTRTLQQLEDMTKHYRFPRDVQRIVDGFEHNAKIPMPILLKLPSGQLYIMSGNTRTDAAFILGIIPKVLVVDVSDRSQQTVTK